MRLRVNTEHSWLSHPRMNRMVIYIYTVYIYIYVYVYTYVYGVKLTHFYLGIAWLCLKIGFGPSILFMFFSAHIGMIIPWYPHIFSELLEELPKKVLVGGFNWLIYG